MKIKCEYCDSFIDDSEDFCPNCGAVNVNMKRVANGVPTTLEELKAFCVEHNLPLTLMRFYIGENYKLPKAFGIYKDEDSGEFVVYKNKADGSRAIRYQGFDEAYAVNEIYLKLQVEMQKQEARKIAQMQSRSQSESRNRRDYSDRTNNSNYYDTSSSSRKSSSNRNGSGNKLKSKIILIIVLIIFGSSILEMMAAGIFGVLGMFTSSGSDYDSSYSYDYYDDDYDYSYNYDYDYSYDDDDWDTDWDSDWDSDYDWDSGSDWDLSYSDWDTDW